MSELGEIVPGEEATQTVEGRFTVPGMPRLQVRNVSGHTTITVGAPGTVHVLARKRVRGASAERAKRLLENVEVRMEQEGDEIRIEPHLYEQERGWLELLRGGRVAVDLEIEVPREAQIQTKSVSGDVRIEGTRGPIEVRGVSAEIDIVDVQGPLRLRTVSGDASCVEYKGQVEANSVSGDLRFERSRLRSPDLVAVSGDVSVEGEIAGPDEGRVKTVSGDVELELVEGSYDIAFKTLSGSLDCDIEGRVTTEGRRDKRVVIGAGDAPLRVKTVSGDLTIRRSAAGPTTEPDRASDERASVEDAVPMGPPAKPTEAKADVSETAPPPPRSAAPGEPGSGSRGRILRIRVTERGKSKVNVAIPLAIARIGKMKLGASGLVRGHLSKFGIDLDELLREVESVGRIVDINDDEDRVEIFVE